jgi:putative spermidine/putrescine transport system permease protein
LQPTFAALAVSTTAGMFLSRNQFKGRGTLLSIMTLPLAFPGVVIGFLIILLGGRQGLVNQLTPGHVVFAYSVIRIVFGLSLFFNTTCIINSYGSSLKSWIPRWRKLHVQWGHHHTVL